jgi:oligo-1,6-glucosidase
LADWDELLSEMHRRGIRLVMDLVVNHTSDEHPWFVESRQSKDNPYRDYYIWRPGKNGHEPNNWGSFFHGSAWQYDETTGEYYLHLFSRRQPDLNWENPQVRASVFAMMKWWLDKGIDGFRMDVINMISKTPGLPDAAPHSDSVYQSGGDYYINGPRLLEFLGEMKAEVLSRYDILTVGETPNVSPEYASVLTNEETGVLSMVFQFEHMDLENAGDKWHLKPCGLIEFKQVMSRWQKGLEDRGWNSIYLGNHDQPRLVSRFGDDQHYRVESAKMLATFMHMQQGTPYIYQGDEIGMTNVKFDSIDDYRDVETLNMFREFVYDKGMTPQAVLNLIYVKGRDNARTPMQWDAGANAGFTTGTPWIKVNPNYTRINVEQARADQDSIFHYYRRLIQLRRANPIITYGTYDLILDDDPEIYAFTRTLENDRLLVILNFSANTPHCAVPESILSSDRNLLISNYPVDDIQELTLRPFEARVYRLR